MMLVCNLSLQQIKDNLIFYFCIVKTIKLNYMQAVCPITDKRINENVARVNAAIAFILAGTFVFFHFWEALVILSGDFIIRGFIDSKYSPVCMASKAIVSTFNLKGKLINAGPKIFAAQVGMVLSVIAVGFFFKQCNTVCLISASLLGVFSFLESVFGFCVACKLYPLFRKI